MLFAPQIAFHAPEAFGFYLPPLLMWGLVALPPFLVLRWLLGLAGFYRLVWHRPLFDTAFYVILLGVLLLALPILAGGQG
ncbi:DUF1656 domain-containing protein [Ancylobacter sp. MQZ15Z-1]|uniref:DUF1656 domain-containing protein n=1 Tax=Ancylobacter mangrovi TaxID=2972472 RepID=A0A9X2T3D1_9HYPH|nr:DUF1656 domain-containing protein [Ancylobacter mangrovi]MCS0496957.1 DUF1656 domain-containing protein [Ancylobacter mangrovi]